MRKLNINWVECYERDYITKKKNMYKIAEEQGCSQNTVTCNFHKLGLRVRTSEETRKGRKQSKEHIENRRIKLIGKIRPMEARRKTSEKLRGKKKTPEHCRRMSEGRKGLKVSEKTKKKLSLINSRENHPQWQGGITPLSKAIRNSPRNKKWREQVFKRDDYTCQDCREKGVYIEAHHIKKFSVIFQEQNIKSIEQALLCSEFWDVSNGKTLCIKCHNKTKRRKLNAVA